ncbi:O-methyltransferase [Thiorhodococcus fuscus]|uniref:O-methyltransferase n=1 Tax=Thiorhodococcus fuscus TaxID=527200 RepID=A0ABW4YC84_9GAMM
MASFDSVNYSLRPSKSIERQIVFEGVRDLQMHLKLTELVYVGLGSVWFTDFIMAHRMLRIEEMISIEREEIGYKRAKFNSPYATVQVMHGSSSEILPVLCNDENWKSRPWLIWLDYDGDFDEEMKGDLQMLIERAPMNSLLVSTFNACPRSYGKNPEDRLGRLQELFRSVVPDNLPKRSVKEEERMQQTLADISLRYMQSVAEEASRPGGFVPAIRIPYQDGAPMVTVGGVLPEEGNRHEVEQITQSEDWLCRPDKPIVAPHLTMREAAVLQSQLPCTDRLTRDRIRQLGFDLEESQIETFQKYYRQYPTFAQILS